jgi:hypothetical protein
MRWRPGWQSCDAGLHRGHDAQEQLAFGGADRSRVVLAGGEHHRQVPRRHHEQALTAVAQRRRGRRLLPAVRHAAGPPVLAVAARSPAERDLPLQRAFDPGEDSSCAPCQRPASSISRPSVNRSAADGRSPA